MNDKKEILIIEQNITIINNQIKLFKQRIEQKQTKRKNFKSALLVLSTVTLLSCCSLLYVNIGLAVGVLVIGITVGSGVVRLLMVDENIKNKTIQQISNKVVVYENELEQQKAKLEKMKQQTKEAVVSKDNETKKMPTTYNIKNLRQKLMTIEMFKKDPELYVEMYNNGELTDIIDVLNEVGIVEDIKLIKFLIKEYQKEQMEKENVRGKTKSKNKR